MGENNNNDQFSEGGKNIVETIKDGIQQVFRTFTNQNDEKNKENEKDR